MKLGQALWETTQPDSSWVLSNSHLLFCEKGTVLETRRLGLRSAMTLPSLQTPLDMFFHL